MARRFGDNSVCHVTLTTSHLSEIRDVGKVDLRRNKENASVRPSSGRRDSPTTTTTTTVLRKCDFRCREVCGGLAAVIRASSSATSTISARMIRIIEDRIVSTSREQQLERPPAENYATRCDVTDRAPSTIGDQVDAHGLSAHEERRTEERAGGRVGRLAGSHVVAIHTPDYPHPVERASERSSNEPRSVVASSRGDLSDVQGRSYLDGRRTVRLFTVILSSEAGQQV